MTGPLDAIRSGAAFGGAAAGRATRLAGRGGLALLDAALASGFVGQAAERVVDTALRSPTLDRLLDRVVESAAAERLVGRVIDGPLLDEAVARLLESEELWLLVDEIARSPAVTDAIGQQSIGFADQVAGVVRTRSLKADDRLEMAARRLLRRRPRSAPPESGER